MVDPALLAQLERELLRTGQAMPAQMLRLARADATSSAELDAIVAYARTLAGIENASVTDGVVGAPATTARPERPRPERRGRR